MYYCPFAAATRCTPHVSGQVRSAHTLRTAVPPPPPLLLRMVVAPATDLSGSTFSAGPRRSPHPKPHPSARQDCGRDRGLRSGCVWEWQPHAKASGEARAAAHPYVPFPVQLHPLHSEPVRPFPPTRGLCTVHCRTVSPAPAPPPLPGRQTHGGACQSQCPLLGPAGHRGWPTQCSCLHPNICTPGHTVSRTQHHPV
jgi:hypothetical protein